MIEDKIVTPEAYVAVPEIQAISYSMDSEELQNLYANLLAKSMYINTKTLVHSSYLEVIKQLSPIDAQILIELGSYQLFPYIILSANEYLHKDIVQEHAVVHYITPITFNDRDSVIFSLSNIERLGLIKYHSVNKAHPNFESLLKISNYLESKSYLQDLIKYENEKKFHQNKMEI